MADPLLFESDEERMRGNYHFCLKCGGPLDRRVIKTIEPPRLVCRACGFVLFLDPKVAVGTIVTQGSRILLVRRGIEPGYGRWVFPGGFVDRGELLQDAAVREALEESGVEIRITRLLDVYSASGSSVVVIVYVAEAIGGAAGPGDETLDARWFAVHEIPWNDLAFPSTALALTAFLNTSR